MGANAERGVLGGDTWGLLVPGALQSLPKRDECWGQHPAPSTPSPGAVSQHLEPGTPGHGGGAAGESRGPTERRRPAVGCERGEEAGESSPVPGLPARRGRKLE